LSRKKCRFDQSWWGSFKSVKAAGQIQPAKNFARCRRLRLPLLMYKDLTDRAEL
jgi:hypothetical protein